jgi:alpha-N-arabinofuranosidase
MDAPWQIGNRSINDYADIARKTASVLKKMDPKAELVACGSSHFYMPTFGKWEAAVLESAWDNLDYISLHNYYAKKDKSTETFLASSVDMNRYIKTVASVCNYIKGIKHSKKDVYLSFDEWNAWGKIKSNNEEGLWHIAPKREEYTYSLEDALVTGSLLITLIKNCNTVKMACQSSLVNVASLIMTENNGKAWKQTIYYPFLHASNYGRGTAFNPALNCDTYQTIPYGTVPYLEQAAVLSENGKEISIFAVNRSLTEDMSLSIELRDFTDISLIEWQTHYNDDIDAINTVDNNDNVTPRSEEKALIKDNTVTATLPKHSWNMIRLGVKKI